VASLSAIGRLGSVVAGAVTGTASGAADDGAIAGSAVPPRTGTSCSTVGADVVPQAVAVSAMSNMLAKTVFMAL
jgi:hypothetical protein